MTDLTKLTLAEARDGLRRKEFSARELAEAYLDAMAAQARRAGQPEAVKKLADLAEKMASGNM